MKMRLTMKTTRFAKWPIYSKSQSISVMPDDTEELDVIRNFIDGFKSDEDWDESFFVGDMDKMFSQVKRFQHQLPRVAPFYAVKANSLQPVIRILASLGLGFDCASKTEITLALKCGVDPDKIIYANPCKHISHVCYAREKGVYRMTLDCKEELLKIKKHFPEARLVLRVHTAKSGSNTDLSEKFGASVEDAKNIIRLAREMNMNMIGVSFHIGSGCPNPDTFRTSIKDSKHLFTFAKICGYEFDFLDIGGGFPGTSSHNEVYSFESMAAVIREALVDYFPERDGVKIIAEPGRYFPTLAFSLVTNVLSRTPHADGMAYFVGDGVRSSFFLSFADGDTVLPFPLNESSNKSKPRRSMIYGESMSEADVITSDAYMKEVDVGDWIVWKEMGGYSVKGHAAFNSFLTYKATYYITESVLKELLDVCEFPELLPELVRENKENTNDACVST